MKDAFKNDIFMKRDCGAVVYMNFVLLQQYDGNLLRTLELAHC